jgi:hypothetical protein
MKHVLPNIYEKFAAKKNMPTSSDKPNIVKRWLGNVKNDSS